MKARPSNGHIFHARSCVSFRGHGDSILLYEKLSHVSHVRFRGNTFPSPSRNVWRHRRHSKSDISHEPSDIFSTQVKMYHRYYVRVFSWACMALRAWNPSPRGLDTLNPQSTCRGSPPGPNLRAESPRVPCVPQSREHKKRPEAGREKMPKGQKNTFIHSNTRFPFEMCAT